MLIPGLFILLEMRKRTERGEYRTWWERSEEKDRERNGKDQYRAWWEKSAGKEAEKDRKDEYFDYPPSWETFGGKKMEKTAMRKVHYMHTKVLKKALI